MFSKCALCRKCSGAAYQTAPMFACGAKMGRFLVIGTAPQELDPRIDTLNSLGYLAALSNEYLKNKNISELSQETDEMLRMIYQFEFGLSLRRIELDELFDSDWLENGKFTYTTAVRCRVHKNVVPSLEMIKQCRSFSTHLVYGRDAIFFVGSTARSQYFSEVPVDDFVYDKKLGLCVFINEKIAWQNAHIDRYRNLIKKVVNGEQL